MSDKTRTNYRQPCSGGTLYTIIPGDWLFGLAQRFNITIEAIIAANPGIDPRNLQIGQQICIPVPPAGPCPGGFLYAIRTGDTYYSIARRFGIVVPALIAANPRVNPNQLAIGQTICVPAPRPTPCPGGRTYSIVPGDTLYSIARRFNVTVQALIVANPGINPNSLRIGQIICIPF
jgi:LysM repeat protein